ncbi:MAG TPA: 50S ribosomal protein L24 [Polyangiaceae bacterium]|nr:50S ribosomal protein L24 [Polyangiaceae bacterium]
MSRIKKGDRVVVIRGDEKGKQGKITRVIPERDMVVIEGVNLVKKHLAATPQRPGGILEVEAPLHASKVMPLDPSTGKRTRVKSQVKDGKKIRVAKSGAEIVGES